MIKQVGLILALPHSLLARIIPEALGDASDDGVEPRTYATTGHDRGLHLPLKAEWGEKWGVRVVKKVYIYKTSCIFV